MLIIAQITATITDTWHRLNLGGLLYMHSLQTPDRRQTRQLFRMSMISAAHSPVNATNVSVLYFTWFKVQAVFTTNCMSSLLFFPPSHARFDVFWQNFFKGREMWYGWVFLWRGCWKQRPFLFLKKKWFIFGNVDWLIEVKWRDLFHDKVVIKATTRYAFSFLWQTTWYFFFALSFLLPFPLHLPMSR